MFCLISPSEPSGGGVRIAQKSNAEFAVAPPLFWVSCAPDVVPDWDYYDLANNQIVTQPPSEPPPVPL